MSSIASRIQSINIRVPGNLREGWRRATPWSLTLIALAIRLYGIEANGLRTDETYSLWMAARTIPDLTRTVIIEGHASTPPTFTLMLHFVRLVSQELWAMRIISVLAGAALVWVTFQLARKLFDYRTAAVSALLMALSPFSIEFSQVARAYSLAGLLAFLSFLYFVNLRISPDSRLSRWLYAITTLAAFSTHYLTGIMVIFENLVVALLSVLRRLSRGELRRWVRLQAVMALASLPVIWLALREIPMSSSGAGQTWLARPSLIGTVRAIILWGTGDPSYGPSGFSLTRLLSLMVIAAIVALGVIAAWKLWTAGPDHREEVLRIAFIGLAFLTPWLLALGISLFRKIFNEKYFLFLIPFLLLLLSWSVLRIRPAVLGRGLLIALLGITMLSLAIYYSSPAGEQWREALAYVRQEGQVSDSIAVMPGFYIRPVSYYLNGVLPPHDYRLMQAPITILGPDGFIPAQSGQTDADLPQAAEVTAQADRLWLITGYASAEPTEVAWFFDSYEPIIQKEFEGVRVQLGESK